MGTQENLPPINEPEVDYSIPKLIVILAAGAVIAAGLGYSFVFGNMIRIALFGAGLLVFLSLQSLFVKDLGRIALFLLIEVGILAGAVVYWNPSMLFAPFAAAVAIFYFLCFLASRSGRKDSESSLKVNFFRIAKSVIAESLPGILILGGVILSVALNPTNKEWIAEKSFEKNVSRPLMAIFGSFVPGISSDMTANDLFIKLAEKSAAAANIGGVNFAALSAVSQQKYIETVAGELKKNVANLAGVPLDLKSSVSKNLYNIAKAKLSETIKLIPSWTFVAVIVAVLFITVESVAWIFYLPLSVIAWIIYEILIFFGFARISLENRSREAVIVK